VGIRVTVVVGWVGGRACVCVGGVATVAFENVELRKGGWRGFWCFGRRRGGGWLMDACIAKLPLRI